MANYSDIKYQPSGSATATYSDMAALIAATGMSAGDQALVTALNKVFMYTGTAWYLVATMTNDSPTAITGVDGTYALEKDGTATTVTAVSTDPEGFPLTFSYAVTTGSLGSTATVSQADNVFTITPSTTEADAGTFSITFSVTDGATGAVNAVSEFALVFGPAWLGERGLWLGGSVANRVNVIEYANIAASTGNATDFGDLTTGGGYAMSATSDGRGCTTGQTASGDAGRNQIDYITIATTGNAQDFGDLSVGKSNGTSGGAIGNGRGLFALGNPSTGSDAIDYITIATLGNAQDFGNASVGRLTGATGTNSATRALFFGGGAAWDSATNTIDYVTIATTGNGTDFGDMTQLIINSASCGDETRAIRFGGYANGPFGNTALMDYITMATTGNATSFGTLHGPSQGEGVGACSDNTKAVCAGGLAANGSPGAGMVKVTIQTTGNSTDFGSLAGNMNHTTSYSGN